MKTTQEDMLKGDFDLCVIQYTHLDGEKQTGFKDGLNKEVAEATFLIQAIKQAYSLLCFLNILWLHRSQFFPLDMFIIVYHHAHVNLGMSVFLQKHVLRPLMCRSRSSIWSAGPVLWRRSVWRPADSKCKFNQSHCANEKLNTFTQFLCVSLKQVDSF